MLNSKKRIIRGYILLGICLSSLGTNYSTIEEKNIQINKFVAGQYHVNSEKENTDNIDEGSVKEENENPTNTVNETTEEAQEEIPSIDPKENQESLGTPIIAELTAYCDDPRCSDSWGSQTAMQTKTRVGVIAAPKNIALGSKMYIPELEYYKADGMFDVEDRGGAIRVKADGTYVIDVWVPTYEEAVKFGRKKTTIYLLA